MEPLERYTEFELPRWRCLPAHVAAADQVRLKPVVAGVPGRLNQQEVPGVAAFRYGVDLFNTGYFWEAHEVWEPVWMALAPNSRERCACQALIQGANACLKLRYGRGKAFARLAGEVDRLVREATVEDGMVVGMALDKWCEEFRGFAGHVEAEEDLAPGFEPTEVPGFPFLVLSV